MKTEHLRVRMDENGEPQIYRSDLESDMVYITPFSTAYGIRYRTRYFVSGSYQQTETHDFATAVYALKDS